MSTCGNGAPDVAATECQAVSGGGDDAKLASASNAKRMRLSDSIENIDVSAHPYATNGTATLAATAATEMVYQVSTCFIYFIYIQIFAISFTFVWTKQRIWESLSYSAFLLR